MSKHFILAGLAASTFIVAGLLSSSLADGDPQLSDQNDPVTHLVEIRGFKFVPEQLTIKTGDTVRWVNVDAAPHTATASDQSWDSGLMKRTQEWSYTATQPGQSDYICTYHPVMTGTLIVED